MIAVTSAPYRVLAKRPPPLFLLRGKEEKKNEEINASRLLLSLVGDTRAQHLLKMCTLGSASTLYGLSIEFMTATPKASLSLAIFTTS